VNRRTDLLEWQRCLRAESHVLRKYPHLLVQQSANQPDEVAPSRAAKPRLAAESKKTPWLQLLNKPRHKDPCLVTLQSPPPSETGGTYSVGYSLGERGLICCISKDGRLVASAYKSGALRIWDAASGSMLAELRGHSNSVNCCQISADGRRLMSRSSSGSSRLWDIHGFREISNLEPSRFFEPYRVVPAQNVRC